MNRREKIAEQLGMNHSTACNRLRKQILFQLVKETKRDICVKCDERIDTIEQLTIEHILPWEGRSAELFWDLDNIGFSHTKCNKPHVYVSKQNPRIREDGWIWCKHHEDFCAPEEFSFYTPNGRRGDGPRPFCKACRKVRKAEGLTY